MGFRLGKTGEEGNGAELISGKASGTFTRVRGKKLTNQWPLYP